MKINPEAQALLDEILKKEPRELTEDDKAFLRARSAYLKPHQLEEFKEVLEVKEEPKEDTKPEEEKPSKKSK